MANQPLTPEQKKALLAFRQRLGGISESKRTGHKELKAARKAIQQHLQSGPATVPELAGATGITANQAFWHLTGMRKYGQVREDGEADGYVRYALVVEASAKASQNGKTESAT